MKVAELISELQKLPAEAEVYVDEPPDDYNNQGSERDPILQLEHEEVYCNGKRIWLHGRVRL